LAAELRLTGTAFPMENAAQASRSDFLGNFAGLAGAT
jgi:hypothetical protein